MKRQILNILSYCFDRDPLGPAILVWVYTVIWCTTVLSLDVSGPITPRAWHDVGWWPNVGWCTGVFVTATYQLVCCRYFHCIWSTRLVASLVTASFVVYTVAQPIAEIWVSYRLFPTLSAGSVVVAIASLLVVARCMRVRKCQKSTPLP